MANWGDDYAVKPEQAAPFRFTLNFKKMDFDIQRIEEETTEFDKEHPKDVLMKLWLGTMIVFLVLFSFSYQILCIATVPFIFFYFYEVIRIAKCWKNFQYNLLSYWIMTILWMGAAFTIAMLIQHFVFK